MSFTNLVLSGAVATGSGSAGSNSGTFSATLSTNADGSVSGTWSLDGNYSDINVAGHEAMSGTVTGAAAAGGGWTLAFAGDAMESGSATLSLVGSQYQLTLSGGYGIGWDYSYFGELYHYTDHFRFQGSLSGDASGGGGNSTGTAANDTINVPAGSASIDGGAGIDTAVFADARANYTVSHNDDGSFSVGHGADIDTLVNVERLQFADAKVALDVHGNGGEAYRLYQAAFDRAPDVEGLGFWINALDHGTTLGQVAASFIGSTEFAARYGSLDNAQFATQLYVNVLHRPPEADGLAFWENVLQQGAARGDVLVGFSESVENQADVIGQIQDGMLYVL